FVQLIVMIHVLETPDAGAGRRLDCTALVRRVPVLYIDEVQAALAQQRREMREGRVLLRTPVIAPRAAPGKRGLHPRAERLELRAIMRRPLRGCGEQARRLAREIGRGAAK